MSRGQKVSHLSRSMDPLHATIEEFAADSYTHIECHCPRCRVTRMRSISWLPRISMGLTIAQLFQSGFAALSAAGRCSLQGRDISMKRGLLRAAISRAFLIASGLLFRLSKGVDITSEIFISISKIVGTG